MTLWHCSQWSSTLSFNFFQTLKPRYLISYFCSYFCLSKGSISLYSVLQLDCASAEQSGLGKEALWKGCCLCHNLLSAWKESSGFNLIYSPHWTLLRCKIIFGFYQILYINWTQEKAVQYLEGFPQCFQDRLKKHTYTQISINRHLPKNLFLKTFEKCRDPITRKLMFWSHFTLIRWANFFFKTFWITSDNFYELLYSWSLLIWMNFYSSGTKFLFTV